LPSIELRFSALPAHVRTARLVAASVARRAGLPEDVIDEVKLAVGEACGRAVGLHARGSQTELIEVVLCDDDAVFEVVVTDRVGSAEAADIALDNVTDLSDDDLLAPGVALAVIEGLVEEVAVETGHGGTSVRMRWSAA
jgi:anti-sigma regulatory factor (Ser/Thr protein kinase)